MNKLTDIVLDETKRVRFKKLQSNYIKEVIKLNTYKLDNETWLKLFPDQFDLKHAMDPFDVHDIDSNDNIVTKYLNDLIK